MAHDLEQHTAQLKALAEKYQKTEDEVYAAFAKQFLPLAHKGLVNAKHSGEDMKVANLTFDAAFEEARHQTEIRLEANLAEPKTKEK
jgi:hypothetical protein